MRWAENPRLILPAWIWPVVDLWFQTLRFASPFGGRPMPCPGAPGEQPAALMDAFTIMDAMDREKDGG